MTAVRTPAHYQRAGSEPRKEGTRALSKCPVARSEAGEWIVLGHSEVVEVAHNDETFSSATSRFLQVPNGLDGELHSAYRTLIDRFFSPSRMQEFSPALYGSVRGIVSELANAARNSATGLRIDAVTELGALAAVRAQSTWLGWDASVESRLLQWITDNHAATRSGELERTAQVAEEFNAIIRSVLEPRRRDPEHFTDVTAELMRETVLLPDGTSRTLNDDELVSILRNWTGGDLGSIALCIGVLVHGLVTTPDIAEKFITADNFDEKAAIIDEFLRLDNPFISNRRVATADTELCGFSIQKGDRLRLNWTAANLDPRKIDNPHSFNPEQHGSANLVYGTGRHVCPGRPLATLELVTVIDELLSAFHIELDGPAEREITPLGGFAHLPVILTSRT